MVVRPHAPKAGSSLGFDMTATAFRPASSMHSKRNLRMPKLPDIQASLETEKQTEGLDSSHPRPDLYSSREP